MCDIRIWLRGASDITEQQPERRNQAPRPKTRHSAHPGLPPLRDYPKHRDASWHDAVIQMSGCSPRFASKPAHEFQLPPKPRHKESNAFHCYRSNRYATGTKKPPTFPPFSYRIPKENRLTCARLAKTPFADNITGRSGTKRRSGKKQKSVYQTAQLIPQLVIFVVLSSHLQFRKSTRRPLARIGVCTLLPFPRRLLLQIDGLPERNPAFSFFARNSQAGWTKETELRT